VSGYITNDGFIAANFKLRLAAYGTQRYFAHRKSPPQTCPSRLLLQQFISAPDWAHRAESRQAAA